MIENFGKNVARIRKELNMTQKDLADRVEINKQTISNIEKGTAYPSFAVLEKISKVLDANPMQLFGTLKEIAVADTPVILSEIDRHDRQIKNVLRANEIIEKLNCDELFMRTLSGVEYLDAFFGGEYVFDEYGEPVQDKDGELRKSKSRFDQLPFGEVNDLYEKVLFIVKNMDKIKVEKS